MNKTLLITHNDVDGVSPIILLNLTGINFEYKSIEISDVDKTFDEINETGFDKYENIYVCDLTLTPKAYEYLDKLKNVKVFDHHKVHLFANEKKYVTVKVDLKGRQTCATELFYEYLKKDYPILKQKNVEEYVEYVRELDTYDILSDIPKKLDLIKTSYGKLDYIKSITKRLKKDKEHFEFTDFEKRLIKLKEQEQKFYLYEKNLKMYVYKLNDLNAGVVFAEKFKSELGQYLGLKHPELDFIIIIDTDSAISYRTVKDDVDVSDIAIIYNGGGHKKASGSPITKETVQNIIKEILKNDKIKLEQ